MQPRGKAVADAPLEKTTPAQKRHGEGRKPRNSDSGGLTGPSEAPGLRARKAQQDLTPPQARRSRKASVKELSGAAEPPPARAPRRRSSRRAGLESAAPDAAGEPLPSIGVLEGLLPALGRQLQEPVAGPIGHEDQHVAQVGPGLDAVQLARGDERDDDCIPFGTLVAADEEPVFPADGLAPQLQLGAIVVCALPRRASPPGGKPGRSTVAPAGSTRSGSRGNDMS